MRGRDGGGVWGVGRRRVKVLECAGRPLLRISSHVRDQIPDQLDVKTVFLILLIVNKDRLYGHRKNKCSFRNTDRRFIIED